MNHKTADCRRSFTLIELLVVISVVAILAGMLVPILASSRRAAKRAGTKNTLMQVATAIGQYSEDWGRFPPDSPKDDRTSGYVAPELLFYYLCTPNLSAKHPYLEPQTGVQTCDFTFVGTGRLVQPTEGAAGNGFLEIADGWQHPIYYDISDVTTAHHNVGSFDIWSGGPNLKNDNGVPGSDDIRHW